MTDFDGFRVCHRTISEPKLKFKSLYVFHFGCPSHFCVWIMVSSGHRSPGRSPLQKSRTQEFSSKGGHGTRLYICIYLYYIYIYIILDNLGDLVGCSHSFYINLDQ